MYIYIFILVQFFSKAIYTQLYDIKYFYLMHMITDHALQLYESIYIYIYIYIYISLPIYIYIYIDVKYELRMYHTFCNIRSGPLSIVANELDSDIVVNEIEL